MSSCSTRNANDISAIVEEFSFRTLLQERVLRLQTCQKVNNAGHENRYRPFRGRAGGRAATSWARAAGSPAPSQTAPLFFSRIFAGRAGFPFSRRQQHQQLNSTTTDWSSGCHFRRVCRGGSCHVFSLDLLRISMVPYILKFFYRISVVPHKFVSDFRPAVGVRDVMFGRP